MSNRGVKDGKGTQGAAAWDKTVRDKGAVLLRFDRINRVLEDTGIYLKQVKFISKDDSGEDWLVVITATGETGDIVGFHGGSSFSECVTGIISKLERNTMRWKDDSKR